MIRGMGIIHCYHYYSSNLNLQMNIITWIQNAMLNHLLNIDAKLVIITIISYTHAQQTQKRRIHHSVLCRFRCDHQYLIHYKIYNNEVILLWQWKNTYVYNSTWLVGELPYLILLSPACGSVPFIRNAICIVPTNPFSVPGSILMTAGQPAKNLYHL